MSARNPSDLPPSSASVPRCVATCSVRGNGGAFLDLQCQGTGSKYHEWHHFRSPGMLIAWESNKLELGHDHTDLVRGKDSVGSVYLVNRTEDVPPCDSCAKIQRNDSSRHFKGCPHRKEQPTAGVAMLLTCPVCHERHIDRGEFATKVHHTHACQSCGTCWRPAIEPTVGVEFLPGFANEGASYKGALSQLDSYRIYSKMAMPCGCMVNGFGEKVSQCRKHVVEHVEALNDKGIGLQVPRGKADAPPSSGSFGVSHPPSAADPNIISCLSGEYDGEKLASGKSKLNKAGTAWFFACNCGWIRGDNQFAVSESQPYAVCDYCGVAAAKPSQVDTNLRIKSESYPRLSQAGKRLSFICDYCGMKEGDAWRPCKATSVIPEESRVHVWRIVP